MSIRGPFTAPLVALSIISLVMVSTAPIRAAGADDGAPKQAVALAVNTASPEEAEAVAFRKLQSELMVATLSCKSPRMTSHYNAFVVRFRAELRANARILKALFHREHGAQAQRRLDAFMTGLANKASLDSMGDTHFCAKADARLEALTTDSKGQTAEAQ